MRERMLAYLINHGGKVLCQAKYNTKISLLGNIYDCIKCNEIYYEDLNSLLSRFDIRVSGIGAQDQNRKITIKMLQEAIESILKKELNIIKPFFYEQCIMSIIFRLNKYSKELNFNVPDNFKYELLYLFNNKTKNNISQFKSNAIENFLLGL